MRESYTVGRVRRAVFFWTPQVKIPVGGHLGAGRWTVMFSPWFGTARGRGGWPQDWRARGWQQPIFRYWRIGPLELRLSPRP